MMTTVPITADANRVDRYLGDGLIKNEHRRRADAAREVACRQEYIRDINKDIEARELCQMVHSTDMMAVEERETSPTVLIESDMEEGLVEPKTAKEWNKVIRRTIELQARNSMESPFIKSGRSMKPSSRDIMFVLIILCIAIFASIILLVHYHEQVSMICDIFYVTLLEVIGKIVEFATGITIYAWGVVRYIIDSIIAAGELVKQSVQANIKKEIEQTNQPAIQA